MWKKIILILVLVLALSIAALLIHVARQPAHFAISSVVTINAAAPKIFPYVNNRKLANAWNPWLLQDPSAKITLSGPEEGVGSKTSWVDGKTLGTGSATVIETIPNERVAVQLEYQKPFVMKQIAAFELKPLGNQTVVTWKVDGSSPFLCRLIGTFMNMHKMVVNTFTKGLNDLKTTVEKLP